MGRSCLTLRDLADCLRTLRLTAVRFAAIHVTVPAAALGIALTPALANSGPRDITVRVSCSVLSDVSAAEFEARAKLDLAARSRQGGELEVVCDDLSAKIRWRERGSVWVSRGMPRAPAPSALIDALLVASKDLVEEVARETEQPPTASPAPAEPAGEEKTPRREDAAAPSDDADARRPPKKEPRETARPLRDDLSAPRAAESSSRAPWGAWGVSVGSQALVFAGRSGGMFGPGVGVYLQLPARLTVQLKGQYDFTLGTGDVVSVHAPGGSAMLVAELGNARAWEIGLGPFAGNLVIDAPGGYTPLALSQTFWGAAASARYAWRKDGWRLAFGADARFYALRADLAVDGTVAWGLPIIGMGLAIELSRELYGQP